MTDSGSFWFSLKFILLFFSPSILIFDIILIHYFVEFRSVFFFFLLNEQNFFLQKYFVIVMKTITKWERLFLKWLIDRLE